MTTTTTFIRATLALAVLAMVSAFAPPSATVAPRTSALQMAPKWDGEKWQPTSAAEEPGAGYGIGKTLLLHGPKPFFNRVFQPDDYEQAVLKFMAQDKCGRIEAQGNMDFYLSNPQDWAFNRLEMEKRGMKYDYTTIDTKQIALTVTWGSGVVLLAPWYFSKVFLPMM